jgi:cytochrome c-type biogenesis protein CcmE
MDKKNGVAVRKAYHDKISISLWNPFSYRSGWVSYLYWHQGNKQLLSDHEGLRLAGRVQSGSVRWDPKALQLSFVLGPFKEKAQAVSLDTGVLVHYQGILPDMFAEERDVIVEGRYDKGNALLAKTIMTSCPSKYEPEQNNAQAAATNP